MKKLLLVPFLFLATLIPTKAQFVLQYNPAQPGVIAAPIDQNGWHAFKLTVSQNVTNFFFNVIPPAQPPAQSTVSVQFVENGTGGFTIVFASNIVNPCTVNTAANATTVCQFIFDSTQNVWNGVTGSGGGGGGSSFPVTTPVAVNSGGSITVNTGGSILTAGTGTIAATTATALAATPNQCTGGQFSTGIQASGNANCATVTAGAATPNGSVQVNNGGALASIPLFAVDNPASPTVLDEPFNVIIGGSATIQGPQPWADIAAFGAVNRGNFGGIVNTTATTTASSTSVTLAAAAGFVNNEGIVIEQAGSPTTQVTPAAPTVTIQNITGTQTIQYECVGREQNGGLTAASAAGSTTVAASSLDSLPQTIQSISQSSGTVTVVLNSAITPLPVAGQHVHVTNVTGNGSTFNGVFQLATVTDGAHITYALAGNAGSGTVSGTSTVRLDVGSFIITAISRTGTTITATTDTAHGISVNAPVIIEGVSPADLNGEYIAGSGTTGSTLVFLNTPLTTGTLTETGSISGSSIGFGQMIAQSWPSVTVTCPTISAPTIGYYIYSDLGTGSFGSGSLIGNTPAYQKSFVDWGSWLRNANGGYTGPQYVPTTPPASAQNNQYAGKITAGAGTVNITVSPAVPTGGSGFFTAHDDGVAVNAALASGGYAQISQPSLFNSPVIIQTYQNLAINTNTGPALAIKANETIWMNSGTQLFSNPGAEGLFSSFDQNTHPQISGVASPLVSSLQLGGSFGIVRTRRINLSEQFPGQILLEMIGTQYGGCENCEIYAVNAVTQNILLIGSAGQQFKDITNVAGAQPLPNVSIAGQLDLTPPIGGLTLKISDAGVGGNFGGFSLVGNNIFSYRGAMVNFVGYNGDSSHFIFDVRENQQPVTPGVMLNFPTGGCLGSDFEISNMTMDSNPMPVVANWIACGGNSLRLKDVNGSFPQPMVTGFAIPGLNAIGSGTAGEPGTADNSTVGQNYTSKIEAFAQTYQNYPVRLKTSMESPYPTPVLISAGLVGCSGPSCITGTNVNVTVSGVAWNGTETLLSNAILVSPNGTNGVTGSWNPVAGVKGYNFYYGSCVQNTSPILATTFTMTVRFGCASWSGDFAGLPLIQPAGSGASYFGSLGIAGGNGLTGFFSGVFQSDPLTANQFYNLPNVTGKVCILGPTTNLFGVVYNGAPCAAVVPPAVQGQYAITYNLPTNAAVAPIAQQIGLTGRGLSGATASDVVLFSDNNTTIVHVQAATGTVNPETLPTATTLNNPTFFFKYCNNSPQTDTIVPTTWTIQTGNNAATTSLSVAPNACYLIHVDPTSTSNWLADASGAAGGSGTPCTTTALSFQFNNAGAFGCVPDLTFSSPHTALLGAAGIVDLSAGAPTAAFKVPAVAGAVPTADKVVGFNLTTHALVWGSNGVTIVGAAAGTGTSGGTTCTSQFISAISATAAPTCTTVTFDKSTTGLGNPTADATFTQPNTSVTGWTLAGTAPGSSAGATGTNASSILNVSGVTGGADSNATGTAGIGSSPTIVAGNGGAGTGTNTVGGAGGSLTFTAGNGGASAGTGANANGGSITLTPGTAGSGGSGAAGQNGVVKISGTGAGFLGLGQGTDNSGDTLGCAASNTMCLEAPSGVTTYTIEVPAAKPTNNVSAITCSDATPGVCSFSKMPQTAMLASQYTNSTTSFTNVALSFSLEANTTYQGSCTLYYQAAATGGLNIEFTGPASPAFVSYGLLEPGSATTLVNASVATAYSTSLGAVVTTATTNFPATVTFGISNGANAGTLQLLAKSSAAVSLQIQTGSFCVMQ